MRFFAAVALALVSAASGNIHAARTLAVRRRPVLAAAVPAFVSADEATDLVIDGAVQGLKFYTFVLDASILLPIIPVVKNLAALQPALALCSALTRPYFNAFERLLPLPFGLSYLPAFMVVSTARKELAKLKFRRRLGRDAASAEAFAHLYQ